MLTGMLRTMLFGIEPLDMRVYIATAFLFVLVAIISAVMPARTAAGIQPASALRTE